MSQKKEICENDKSAQCGGVLKAEESKNRHSCVCGHSVCCGKHANCCCSRKKVAMERD